MDDCNKHEAASWENEKGFVRIGGSTDRRFFLISACSVSLMSKRFKTTRCESFKGTDRQTMFTLHAFGDWTVNVARKNSHQRDRGGKKRIVTVSRVLTYIWPVYSPVFCHPRVCTANASLFARTVSQVIMLMMTSFIIQMANVVVVYIGQSFTSHYVLLLPLPPPFLPPGSRQRAIFVLTQSSFPSNRISLRNPFLWRKANEWRNWHAGGGGL